MVTHKKHHKRLQKNVGICLVFFALSFSSYAQFGRPEIKKSKIVQSEIKLDIVDKDNLDVFLDSKPNKEKKLKEKDYFQVKGDEFRIYAEFVNPLRYIYKSSHKELDNELFLESAELINNISSYLVEVRKASLMIAKVKPVVNGASKAKLEPKLADMFLSVQGQDASFFTTNSNFFEDMKDLKFAKTSDSISKNYSTAFENLYQITEVSKIDEVINITNKNLLTTSNNLMTELNKRFIILDDEFDDINFTAAQSAIKREISKAIKELKEDMEALEATKKEIDSKYSKLKSLYNEIYKNRYKGKIADSNKFLIDSVLNIKRSKRYEVTIVLEKIEYDSAKKSIKVESSKSFLLNVIRKTTFTPVVSSGVLYTSVSFPQFGTDMNAAGETVVTETQSNDNEIAVAAYLNLYLNNTWGSSLFLQLGTGPSKEKPLIFLGAGVEVAPKFTLSAGTVFTWYPKLNDLSIGDVVNGSSAINEDISFEFQTRPRFYFGISIDLTNK